MTEASVSRARADALVPMVLAAACAVVAVAALAVVAGLAGGDRALAGALVGGLAVLGVLLFGVVTLAAVVKVAPDSALLVAMMTYVLQVMVLISLYVRYEREPAMRDAMASGWLAGGILAGTGAWVLGHVIGAFRARHVDAPWPAWEDEDEESDVNP